MTVYTNFLGIDIGKFNFVVAIHGNKTTSEYENSSIGIAKFIEDNSSILENSLAIIEATGGYELELVYSLVASNYKVHRADSRKVKNFIRSFGNVAKTDALDSKALAKYGYERSAELELFAPADKNNITLFQLVQRRNDLTSILVAEKNRLQGPSGSYIKDSIELMIETISKQIKSITEQIEQIMNSTPKLKQTMETLKLIPGIGNIVAFEILILLPELGKLCRRKIASLAGVAPRSNESGKFYGYRKTGYGRFGIKRILFIAAMAARNSKTHLRDFYEKLIAKGKKKMVALTALMRKILVIANAKIKSILFI